MVWRREPDPQDTGPRADQPGSPVLDRRHFLDLAEREVQKARQFHYPVSLVTVLVESLDTDAVPRTGEAIRTLIRRSDVIGLVPGLSALHLLLRDAMLSETRRVVERIRASATASSVTVKFGAACLPATAQTLYELMEQADQAAVQSEPGP